MNFPIEIVERTDKGLFVRRDHPYATLLSRKPNPEQNIRDFMHAGVKGMCMRGNFYADILRNQLGDVVAMYTLQPNQVTIKRKNGELKYYVRGVQGTTELDVDEVLHVTTPAWNI